MTILEILKIKSSHIHILYFDQGVKKNAQHIAIIQQLQRT